MIRKDCTRHQIHRMEATKAIRECSESLDVVNSSTSKCLEFTVLLQRQIFASETPFELQLEDEDTKACERVL